MRELSHHLLDLLENALEAGATRLHVCIAEDMEANLLTIEVIDNGRGMNAEEQVRALDPFYTTRATRHVGLGLPLLKEAAERCNGKMELHSEPGRGTKVRVTFQHDHIDRAPLGDIPSTLLGALLADRPAWDLEFVHRVDGREFRFNTQEIRSILGDIPFSEPLVRDWIDAYLRQGYEALYSKAQED